MGSTHILILAAGKGTRMKSKLPKVLHPVLFRPMLHHVLDLATSIPHESITTVVGYGENLVRESCKGYEGVHYVTQKEQKGTADAVMASKSNLSSAKGTLVVLCGDVVLFSKENLNRLLTHHQKTGAACTLTSSVLSDPASYGRILRDDRGVVQAIRESRDCTEEQKKITEVNAGIYCFELDGFFDRLQSLDSNNDQGEYYLTDMVESLVTDHKLVEGFILQEPVEMTGINDRVALAVVEREMQTRINQHWMLAGVSLQGPETIWIDSRTVLASDVTIESGCRLVNSQVDVGVRLEANCRLESVKVGSGTHIKQGSYLTDSVIGRDCAVGPYAHFRPESVAGNSVKIGNFVEIKKAVFKDGSKASHLSYIGDAEVGKNTNLGCGFVTCNYDGVQKHRTLIGDNVFVGSDSQTVAPVTIHEGAYVASGTIVTEDVPAGAMAISRGRQTTKPGYAKKYQK